MTEDLEPVAYLFDYEDEKEDGKVLVPVDLELNKDDPRTSQRWSHVDVTEIHELVKREEVSNQE